MHKVQEIKLRGTRKRYLLIDDNGLSVNVVNRFLKFHDNTGHKPRTLRSYCYALKHYFDYLEEKNKSYTNVTIHDISDFVAWLRKPEIIRDYIFQQEEQEKPKRCEETVNNYIAAVTGFYDYLFRIEETESDIYEKLLIAVRGSEAGSYKEFLSYTKQDGYHKENILMLKKKRRTTQYLDKESVNKLFNACSNIRDKLIIKLLFETGFRISELLSLWVTDIIFDHKDGHKIKLTDRGEDVLLKSGERVVEVSQEVMDIFDDYMYDIYDEINPDTNFVFIKISGQNKGKPLEYQDIYSLMKRLTKKTGIKINSHLLRHTNATLLYRATKNIKLVQERLGHAQVQTTIQFYVHTNDEDNRREWEKAKSEFEMSRN